METAKIKQLIVEHKDRFLKKGLLVRRTIQDDLGNLEEAKGGAIASHEGLGYRD